MEPGKPKGVEAFASTQHSTHLTQLMIRVLVESVVLVLGPVSGLESTAIRFGDIEPKTKH